MKNPTPAITVSLALAIVSAILIVALRSFAQTPTPNPKASFNLTIVGWQKLKAQPAGKPQYDEDGNAYERDILATHNKSYCIRHQKKSDGTETTHGNNCHPAAASTRNASQSSLIPVVNSSSSSVSPTPTPPVGGRPTGSNVTQQISGANLDDLNQIIATFDTSGGGQ